MFFRLLNQAIEPAPPMKMIFMEYSKTRVWVILSIFVIIEQVLIVDTLLKNATNIAA